MQIRAITTLPRSSGLETTSSFKLYRASPTTNLTSLLSTILGPSTSQDRLGLQRGSQMPQPSFSINLERPKTSRTLVRVSPRISSVSQAAPKTIKPRSPSSLEDSRTSLVPQAEVAADAQLTVNVRVCSNIPTVRSAQDLRHLTLSQTRSRATPNDNL